MITKIGKYEIREELGHDAFIRTFRAFDPDAARPVAILVLTEVADRQRLDAFRRDAAAAANLHHRNIAAIYELGEHAGLPFIAMQDLQGDPLRQVIANRLPLTLLQKLSLMFDLAEGMKVAHRGGIAHLGLRPPSIILSEDGSAKIAEFGAVRSPWTTNGSAPDDGSLYMSPEQLDSSAPPDSLSDVFLYGVICYELLAGKHPFAAADPQGVAFKIVNEDPAPLRTLTPDCPEALEQIVHRALQKDRDLRYQSLDDAQIDTEPVLQELKQEHAAVLLVESHKLLDEDALDRAQAAVREALQLDPGNREARDLHEKIRGQLQRRIIRSRLDAVLARGNEQIKARRFDEAVRTLESGLRLDAADAAVGSRLGEARALLERSESAAALLAEAQRLAGDGKLAEGRESASAALAIDRENEAARQLLGTIEEALERRERDLRFEEELAKAKNLLLIESFEEAISILLALDAARPGSPQLAHWLAHTRTQKSVKDRQERLQAGLDEAIRRLEDLQFQETFAQLEVLSAEFPEADAVRDLWADARNRLQAHERAQAIERICSTALALRQVGDLAGAIRVLEEGRKTFPEEAPLQRALDDTSAALAAQEREQAIAGVVEDAHWFLDQRRPDLAVELLRRASAEYPQEPELAEWLALAEKALADWERRQSIQETLARASALEQREQWRTALTVIEEALKVYPGAPELDDAIERLQGRIRENERQRRLARRLDFIRQKFAENAWTQALGLIEAAQKDFPEEPELEALLAQCCAQQQRADYEGTIAQIEQCLDDDALEEAAEIVRRAIESYPEEGRIRELQKDVEREKAFRDQWQTAEVLFGRRQFLDAERILLDLASQKPNSPNVRRLLEAVRSERAESEEKQFLDRGRVKALRLIEEQQFDEAIDLLRNLRSLFPNDSILERDLQLALAARDENGDEGPLEEARAAAESRDEECVSTPRVIAVAAPIPQTLPPMPPSLAHGGRRIAKLLQFAARRRRPALLSILLCLLVTSSTVVLWMFSRKQGSVALASPEPALTRPADRREAAPGTSVATESSPSPFRAAKTIGGNKSAAPTRRVVEAATVWQPSGPSRSSAPVSTLPPAGIEAGAFGAPGSLSGSALQPLASPVAAPVSAVGDLGPAQGQPERTRVGGEFREAQLVSGPPVVIPALARERKIYGVVKLEATVSKEGKVTNVAVVSGPPALVETARQAILARRYQPATLNGEPIEVKMPIQVVFDPGR